MDQPGWGRKPTFSISQTTCEPFSSLPPSRPGGGSSIAAFTFYVSDLGLLGARRDLRIGRDLLSLKKGC
jgi:hypothetical protein